ncbi:DUF1980 domain-containing protein [Fundidesulfovibrio agrisoli]|uniref:TIGR03943 family putative permease subunit n=1 Tax=Fundidesulfovibrio agrisoli TaxID=2922717 RepID=UPI001FACDF0B|nr:DUF1980 domain-containing protein [Fundidesulfovibrio agrisoli]
MTPRRLPATAESLCLLGLAGFMAWLLLGGDYWMYLNPRFKALTWAAAGALALLGGYGLWRPSPRAAWLRAGLFAFTLALCVVSGLAVHEGAEKMGAEPQAMREAEATPEPRVKKRGVEYIRINLGELYDIVGKPQPELIGLDYAVRGFVRRTPELDAEGEFVLYRVALYCCYADSTAVGFRVRPPKGGKLPENGAWVVAYGKLDRLDRPKPEAEESLGGSAFSSVNEDYRIAASLIEAEKAPGMGMMYEWRPQEPYAY